MKVVNEEVALLPARALYWPREATLFVADPHFGKADAFQAAGVPVPGGATATDLARLSSCLATTGATRLVVLGDFFHAKASQSDRVLAALAAWRAAHTDLDVLLVQGNHDRHAGPPPASLGIATVDEPYVVGPFTGCHHPPSAPGPVLPGYVLAGHEHPVAALRDVDGSRHRLPCFHMRGQHAVLPAFGSFTGGHKIRPVVGDRVFVIGGDAVYQMATK